MTTHIKLRHAISHLNAARCYSHNSFAVRLKVGSIIVKGDIPIALGWNGRLPGEPNTCEDKQDDGSLVTRSDVRHAEINALNKIYRSTESAVGSIMFCTTAACKPCAENIVLAGLSGFVFEDNYRSLEGIEYLLNKGIQVYQYDRGMNKFFAYRMSTSVPNIVKAMIGPCSMSLSF